MSRTRTRVAGAWLDLPGGVQGPEGPNGPPGPESHLVVAYITGVVGPGVGGMRFYNPKGVTLTILAVTVGVSAAPVGGQLTVDTNVDGTTIFTNQAHRPSIASGSFFARATLIDAPTWGASSYISFDVDEVGTTTPGSNATMTVLAVP